MRPRKSPDDQAAGETSRVVRLRHQIAEASRLRGLVRNPDLQAVEMERHRRHTLRGLWFFLALGLVFTTTGVQRFLAGDTTSDDPLWWAAWTVEPMFAGLLIVLLNFEAIILAHGVEPDHVWWHRLKRVLLASTLFMNVVPQLAPLVGNRGEFNLGGLAVHLLIPVIVYGLAEVIPVIQARARQVILQGYDQTDQHKQTNPPEPTAAPTPEPDTAATSGAEVEPAPPTPATAVKRAPKLPPPVVDSIRAARDRAAGEGREFTAADVHQVIKVSDAMAEQIVADFVTNNGHVMA